MKINQGKGLYQLHHIYDKLSVEATSTGEQKSIIIIIIIITPRKAAADAETSTSECW